MNLAQQIRAYYFNHFDELKPFYQEHFAGRLYYWCQDTEARRRLDAMPHLTGNSNPRYLENRLRAKLQDSPRPPHINGGQLREKYFARYPQLRTYNAALFQLLHWDHLYQIDMRSAFWQQVDKAELLHLQHQLMADPEAFAVLSTYAVNFVYLLQRYLLQDDTAIDIQWIHDLRDHYNLEDKTHIQLFIYLYTHSILGESLFYVRHIPAAVLPLYTSMLQTIETLITRHYDLINLDNKFEFLVCAQVCGYDSTLQPRIWEEASQSVSPEGNFIIDTLNQNAQEGKTDLQGSEHRNVLYIMSTLPFRPLQATAHESSQ